MDKNIPVPPLSAINPYRLVLKTNFDLPRRQFSNAPHILTPHPKNASPPHAEKCSPRAENSRNFAAHDYLTITRKMKLELLIIGKSHRPNLAKGDQRRCPTAVLVVCPHKDRVSPEFCPRSMPALVHTAGHTAFQPPWRASGRLRTAPPPLNIWRPSRA